MASAPLPPRPNAFAGASASAGVRASAAPSAPPVEVEHLMGHAFPIVPGAIAGIGASLDAADGSLRVASVTYPPQDSAARAARAGYYGVAVPPPSSVHFSGVEAGAAASAGAGAGAGAPLGGFEEGIEVGVGGFLIPRRAFAVPPPSSDAIGGAGAVVLEAGGFPVLASGFAVAVPPPPFDEIRGAGAGAGAASALAALPVQVFTQAKCEGVPEDLVDYIRVALNIEIRGKLGQQILPKKEDYELALRRIPELLAHCVVGVPQNNDLNFGDATEVYQSFFHQQMAITYGLAFAAYQEAFLPALTHLQAEANQAISFLKDDWRALCHRERTDFRGAYFQNCRFEGLNIGDLNLSGADFENADFTGVRILGTAPSLVGVRLSRAQIEQLYAAGLRDFRFVIAREVNLGGLRLIDADFSGAYLEGAQFAGSNLTKGYFKGSHLRGVSLAAAVLTQTNFEGADLAEVDLGDVSLEAAAVPPSFQGACLTPGQVISLYTCGLINFQGVICTGDMSHAHLAGADFRGADLSGVNFEKADLSGVNFERANLSGVRLKRSNLEGAILVNADLEGATGLESAKIAGVKLIEDFMHYSSALGLQAVHALLKNKSLRGVESACVHPVLVEAFIQAYKLDRTAGGTRKGFGRRNFAKTLEKEKDPAVRSALLLQHYRNNESKDSAKVRTLRLMQPLALAFAQLGPRVGAGALVTEMQRSLEEQKAGAENRDRSGSVASDGTAHTTPGYDGPMSGA